MPPPSPLLIATSTVNAGDARTVLLLVRSLRAYGGVLADSPVWVFEPYAGTRLSDNQRAELRAQWVHIIEFQPQPELLAFPFGGKVVAAAAAEARAVSGAPGTTLVWCDPDTLFLREPQELLLQAGEALACVPVHHRLIGALYGQPLDAFWTELFTATGVDPTTAFPMRTATGDAEIYPYFSAGLLAVRPSEGLLTAWAVLFRRLSQSAIFRPYFEAAPLNRIFMHQALLSAVILGKLPRSSLRQLPATYNFPLHLAAATPPELLPEDIAALVTCRYEDIATLASGDWHSHVPVRAALQKWLTAQLGDERPTTGVPGLM